MQSCGESITRVKSLKYKTPDDGSRTQMQGLMPSDEVERQALHPSALDTVRRRAHDSKLKMQAENKEGAERARALTFSRTSVVLRLPEAQRLAQISKPGGGGSEPASRWRKEAGQGWSARQLEGAVAVAGERVPCTDPMCPFSFSGSHSSACKGR
jgi:hypothetical protein